MNHLFVSGFRKEGHTVRRSVHKLPEQAAAPFNRATICWRLMTLCVGGFSVMNTTNALLKLGLYPNGALSVLLEAVAECENRESDLTSKHQIYPGGTWRAKGADAEGGIQTNS